MFEHLGHIHRQNFKLQKDKQVVLPSLLVTSMLIFVMSFFMYKSVGVDAIASPGVTLAVNSKNKDIVAWQSTPVFEFVVTTDQANISLDYLKIYANGLYDASILNNLKLYHQGTQLGTLKNLDEIGNLYFETNDYKLAEGQNHFYVMLDIDSRAKAGDFLQFSLPDEVSIVLKKDGHIFTPDTDYPLVGGSVSFVNHGSIEVYNNLADNQLVLSNIATTIGDFRLTSFAEIVDINQIVINPESAPGTIDDAVFYLVQDKNLLAYGQNKNNQIVFDFVPQVLSVDKNIELQIVANGLRAGEASFYLEYIAGTGFVSGQTIVSSDRLLLSQLDIKNSLLQFENSDINSSLVEGQNILSDILVTSLGSDSLGLQKMAWKIDYQNLEITNFKVSIDDRLYQTGVNIQGDKISIYFDEPLEISDRGVHVKLLADIKNLKNNSQISTYLLSDDQLIDQDQPLDSHILWTDFEDLFSGYLLPDLPFDPVILN